jgi:hypothetical protein
MTHAYVEYVQMPKKDLPHHGVVAAASLLAAGGNLKRLRRTVERLPPLLARCGLMAVKNSFLVEVQEAGLPGSHGVGLKEHDSETTPPTGCGSVSTTGPGATDAAYPFSKTKSECSSGH